MTVGIHPRLSVAGLLLLTASTGAVDAASYLGLDRVFTGNMTGNVLFIGFALVGVGGIPLLNNAIALLAFAVGSIVGGRLVARGHRARSLPRRSAIVLASGAALLLALAMLWLGLVTGGRDGLGTPVQLTVTGLLAVVMGCQVAAVKPIGNSDVTTIVVTNTIANLARESRAGGGAGERWVQRLLAVTAMAAGAALGALGVAVAGGWLALLAAAILSATAVVVLVVAERRAV